MKSRQSPFSVSSVFSHIAIVGIILAGTTAAANMQPKGKGGGGGGGGTPADPAIVYEHGPSNNREIRVMDADGANRTTVLKGGNYLSMPSFSADGQEVIFAHGASSGNNGIWAVGVNGTNLRMITPRRETTGRSEWSPAPSVDGEYKIAFVDTLPGVAGAKLYIVNTDGSGRQQLTFTSRSESHPTWSPDAMHLAFSTSSGLIVCELGLVGNEISIISEMNITAIPGSPIAGLNIAMPSWSNGGDHIAVRVGMPEHSGNGDLWLIDLNDLANPIRLTNSGDNEICPTWAPDDSALVYSGGAAGGVGVMSLDTFQTVSLLSSNQGRLPSRRRH
jgi:Tol biopolymer transport system component